MKKQEKLSNRFCTKPRDFTFDEMKKLLKNFGYQEIRSGKTSGARIAFMNKSTRHIIRLLKPHPGKIMKRYQLYLIEDELKKQEILK
ncbi:MAG: type II toxin-antitoxin system HicA family toxin [Candidatus Aminicenantes bacterium]|nr:type II toxin-antitoxin system HicA family toxin [Candidatus Aminicenantes bacterium]